jgi:hypothetical protein
MTPYETTREKITTLVKSFHAAHYPTTEVNMPKRFFTDVEHIDAPFVTVELTLRLLNMGLVKKHCVKVTGQLILNHFTRINSGFKVHSTYTDTLVNYFGLETLDGITFHEVDPFDNSGIPGFQGIMNAINFEIEYFNT